MRVHPAFGTILATLDLHECTIPHFLLSLLISQHPDSHRARRILIENLQDVLDALLLSPESSGVTRKWSIRSSAAALSASVIDLAQRDNGWHFSAVHASPEQIRDFQIRDLAEDVQEQHPELWDFLGALKVVIISIMMQSINQRCNALQSIMGIFLHSCNAPEKVVKTLAHMGLSVSLSSIHHAIHSLAMKASLDLQIVGKSRVASYAYDNFDIDFKTTLPTIEQSVDTLLHLTSGLIFRLAHGVKLEDLKCSEELWKKSRFNDQAAQDPPKTPEPVEKIPVTKLSHYPVRAMDINQSKVSGNIEAIEDLLAQGGVGDPDDEDEHYDVEDITPFVVLVHGDLGTLERVQSAQERRAIEDTPWRRLQSIVLVPGFFHLKMAAADAIWRIFISEKGTQDDPNSLRTLAGILRPKETGKIASKPGFRRTHEIILHVGTVLRLDCWRLEANRRDARCATLHDFAASEPTWDDILEMSYVLADKYVAGTESVDIFEIRARSSAIRDQQYENTLILHQYLLLYEELSYSMNAGDMGRIETVVPSWIWIFRATGKHKYASGMLRFMTDVHFLYPEGLKRAVRYNCLVNPTGKPNEFRAVDWLVELNNLFTKETYGGSGSNYTKKRVLEESVLVEIYRACHKKIERDLHLPGLTYHHAAKNMEKTFEKLSAYIQNISHPNEIQRGRKSAHLVEEKVDKGQGIYANGGDFDSTEADDGMPLEIELEDLEVDDNIL
ncbi:hypothetical protein FA95DRAFT_1482269 [Auriscalpium vulgare]|uniref:Uncharacterized protein n=1 Tax=Auriscalpium vulgare TaxID=40419 RepID=A0ACB8SAH6_9AGAM|nr:hypothetical protein FA95DRAFT_1482269 [Auriscalpium vulgare]